MFKAKGKLISLLTACFAAVLALVMAVATLSVQPKTASAADGAWTLVTSVSDLAAGDQVVIVTSGTTKYALSTTQSGNYRTHTAVTKDDTNKTVSWTGTAVQELTLKAGNTAGSWAFDTGSGYLQLTSNKNYLTTSSSSTSAPAITASWTISIDASGVATISNCSYTSRAIKYNSSSPRFATYTSGQTSVCLYKLVVSSGSTCDHVYDDGVETTPATCTTAGVKTYTCTIDGCGHSYTDTIDALGHNYVAGTAVNGIITYTCDRDGCNASYEGYVGPWDLVTDIASLKVGDKVVIAASAANQALSTTQNSNNRGQAAITKDTTNNTISWEGNAVQVLTLEEGATAGTWAFYTGSKYLYSPSANNYIREQASKNVNASWSISIDSTNGKTTIFNKSQTAYEIQYNSNNSIFSCYKSTQGAICLYELHTEESGESGGEATVTDADKVAKELSALSFGVEVAADAEVALSTAGATYSEVAIAWGATNGTIADNKLSFTGVTTLTATATCGEASDSKSFTIYRGDSELTIAQALALANTLKADSTYKYYVSGTVKNIAHTTYGNMTIVDANGDEIYVYGVYGDEQATIKYEALEIKPIATDEVKLYSKASYYNNSEQLKNAMLVSMVDNTPEVVEPEADSELTIPEAVELGTALGGNSKNKYYIWGKVKSIASTTYGNLTIEDADGKTIYVYGTWDATGANRYDKMTNAPKVGDEVKLYSIVSYYNGPQLKDAWIVDMIDHTFMAAQAAAKAELAAYKNADDYREVEKAQLASIVANAKVAIDTCADEAAVDVVVADAKAQMDALKTNAQYEAEEAAALARAKETAKAELAAYKSANDYRTAEWQEIQAILAEANTAIDACADNAAINDKVASTKAVLDAVKTNQDYELEEAADLAAAQANAKSLLAAYKNVADYREAEQAQIASILANANAAIEACEEKDEVSVIVAQVKAELDAVKTNAQYEAEEAAALTQAKAAAKAELAAYKNADDYREIEKAELNLILANTNAAIDACESIEAVTAKVAEAKVALDALKTDAVYDLEEAQAAAKAELAAYKNAEDYRDAEQAQIAEILSKVNAAIDSCEEVNAIGDIVVDAKEALDALKTDAIYDLEEAKAAAKAELASYKKAADYREAEQAQLATILAEAIPAIEACESVEAVNAKLAAAKADLDALKTDAEYKAELAQAKKDAMAELEKYIKREDYRDAEILQRARILEIARVAINDCTSIEAVAAKVVEMKASLDELKTRAQHEAEEAVALAKAIEDGKAKLNKHFAEYDKTKYYPEEQALLDACLAEYITKMEAATSIDGTRAVYHEFTRKMLEIEKIPSLSLDNLAEKDANGVQSLINKGKDAIRPYVPEAVKDQVKAITGCSGVVGGVAGGVAALGIAVIALCKKKNGKDE